MTCFRLNYYYFHRKLSNGFLINLDISKRNSFFGSVFDTEIHGHKFFPKFELFGFLRN